MRRRNEPEDAEGPMAREEALAARGVGYQASGRDLVAQVDLVLEPGTVTALVGPNGAGKSTLLGLLCGDLEPAAGTVRLAGREISAWRPRELALRRSMMLQQQAAHFSFSVEEAVSMGRVPHRADPPEDARIVAENLAESDLARLRDRDVTTLSGGESARVAFARTVTQATSVILLDEPTAALDLRAQEEMLRAARRRRDRGACVVAVLHDLNQASRYADRVIMLARGRVVADGAPARVLTAERIQEVYGQPVHLLAHPDTGVPVVVPAHQGEPVRERGGRPDQDHEEADPEERRESPGGPEEAF